MQPNEKNAFWALKMFSIMAVVGLRSEVHLIPKHFDAVVGFKVVLDILRDTSI